MNGERARAGLGRLASRDDVVAVATVHTTRMVAAGEIFHNDAYFSETVRKQLSSAARGENVAKNSDVDDTHARLMKSPGHRANILDPRFSVAGFSVVEAPDGQYFTTQNFLQPAGAAPAGAPPPADAPSRRAAPPNATRAVPAAAAPTVGREVAVPAAATAAAVTAVTPAIADASGGGDGLVALAGRHVTATTSPGSGPTGHDPRTWGPAAVLLALAGASAARAARRTGGLGAAVAGAGRGPAHR